MTDDYDPRLKHPMQYGETIALPELIQRWQPFNTKLINRLCFENKLMPKLGSRWSTVKKERGKPPIFIFTKIPLDSGVLVSEDEQDAPEYEQLPDNAYFDLQDILHYEDKHPELKLSNVRIDTENVQVVVKITGRDAFPVWVLPYVTGWSLSIDMLLDRLANPHYDPIATFPDSFQLDNNHHPLLIPEEQWEEIYIKVKCIDEKLKNEGLSIYHGRAEWRTRSIEKIQQYKSYIWLDEFQGWFNKQVYAYERVKIDVFDSKKVIKRPGVKLCLRPDLSLQYAKYFKSEVNSLKAKTYHLNTFAPLDSIDREAQEESIFKNGSSTIALGKFIDVVLAEAIGDKVTLPTFYQLIEKHELIVHDKVIDGKEIPSNMLLNTLRQREQQANDSFENDSFKFWSILNKEYRYSIYRKDIADAYKNAGKLTFPWKNLADEFVWLNYLPGSSNGMEEKRKLKERLPQEPAKLNIEYKPKGIDKQQSWDMIPDINQKYWKHKDTLTIIEFAFILKGKEPQLKATQGNVIGLYPLDFCEFLGELLTQSDSSWKIGKLIEINSSAPYCEEWADTPEFEKDDLIKWAVSKEIKVPSWLMSNMLIKNNSSPFRQLPIQKSKQVKSTETSEQKKRRKNKATVNNKFASFQNLRTNQISLVMMEGKAKVTIEGDTFDVLPVDLGLKLGTQGWKLLEGAAVSSGDLTEALKKLNRTSDREKETTKIKAAICRLRQNLKSAMGLEDSPIITSSGSYRFTFKVMTHEMLKDSNVSKGADAMDYADYENFDDNKHHSAGFYSEESDD